MKPLRHKLAFSAFVLLAIYVLHFFLLDGFLPSHTTSTNLSVDTRLVTLVRHAHHRHHPGLAFIRMLEKHEGAKQKLTIPAAAIPTLVSHIILFVTEQPVAPVAYIDTEPLSPSSYRLYLQDRVFRI